MECQIGEIRKVGNKWLQCVESACNKECYFYNRSLHKTIAGINDNDFGACNACFRSDDKSVIFKELEKIGGPYDDCGTILQRFKIYTNVTNADTKGLELHIYSNDTIGIEVKQNKKEVMDMHKVTMNIDDRDYLLDKLESILHDTHCQQYKDEICEAFSKYIATENASGLKPFDLNAAKAGKPVCTGDGRQARIICFDRKDIKPIVALVTVINDTSVTEKALYYFEDGHHLSKNYDDINDLVMLPEKRSGWINVYKDSVYDTKDEAINGTYEGRGYIDTVKVSWEE